MTRRMLSPTLSLCSARFGCHGCCWNADRSFLIFHVTTWSSSHMTWWAEPSNLPNLDVPGIMEKQLQDFWFVTWPRHQKVTWLSGWGLSTVSYHSAKFGGHRYCGRADIRFYICHVTTWSKGHLTRYVGSSDSKLPPCHVWRP